MILLPMEITHNQARACAASLRQSVAAVTESSVMLDASPLVKFDSSALAVLLQCRREALAKGYGFAVQGLTPRLQALAAMYGVDNLLTSV